MKTIVIGGGAAGLMAAVTAASCGDSVVILERMDRVGRKILATGNGRCNLMNTGKQVYYGDADFAGSVLKKMSPEKLWKLFETIGLRLRQEEMGRVYPSSGQASTVLDVLRANVELFKIQVKCGFYAEKLECGNNVKVRSKSGETVSGDRVIVTGGGKAQEKLGSDGSCYSLLTGIGHSMVQVRPALSQIITDTDPIRGLSGMRCRAEITVSDGKIFHTESGEILFADYGISGVCSMQCARFVDHGAKQVHINYLKPMNISQDQFAAVLEERLYNWAELPAAQLLTGFFTPKLAQAIMRQAGICTSGKILQLQKKDCEKIAACSADFCLTATGIKGFESAQVTSGGISCDGFSPENLQSKLCPRVYAAGEILNVDGDCGGFNLMFAFATGALAGFDNR